MRSLLPIFLLTTTLCFTQQKSLTQEKKEPAPASPRATSARTSTGAWRIRKTKDPMDDSSQTTFSLASVSGTDGLMVLRCTVNKEGKVKREFYVSTPNILEEDHGLELRLDNHPAFTTYGSRSTDYKAIFIDDREPLLDQGLGPEDIVFSDFLPPILTARRVLARVREFHGTDKLFSFAPAGIDLHLVTEACRLDRHQYTDAEQEQLTPGFKVTATYVHSNLGVAEGLSRPSDFARDDSMRRVEFNAHTRADKREAEVLAAWFKIVGLADAGKTGEIVQALHNCEFESAAALGLKPHHEASGPGCVARAQSLAAAAPTPAK